MERFINKWTKCGEFVQGNPDRFLTHKENIYKISNVHLEGYVIGYNYVKYPQALTWVTFEYEGIKKDGYMSDADFKDPLFSEFCQYGYLAKLFEPRLHDTGCKEYDECGNFIGNVIIKEYDYSVSQLMKEYKKFREGKIKYGK